MNWYIKAYDKNIYKDRLITEAHAALPMIESVMENSPVEQIYTGMQHQRTRLKTDQQLAEWDGCQSKSSL